MFFTNFFIYWYYLDYKFIILLLKIIKKLDIIMNLYTQLNYLIKYMILTQKITNLN